MGGMGPASMLAPAARANGPGNLQVQNLGLVPNMEPGIFRLGMGRESPDGLRPSCRPGAWLRFLLLGILIALGLAAQLKLA